MKRFEYARVYIDNLTDIEVIDHFNMIGEQGWELVSLFDRIPPNVQPQEKRQVAYFKREIIEHKNP